MGYKDYFNILTAGRSLFHCHFVITRRVPKLVAEISEPYVEISPADAPANTLTISALDPVAKIAETKFCAARIGLPWSFKYSLQVPEAGCRSACTRIRNVLPASGSAH
ncbi:MAG: hypothetical protein ACOCS6_00815 [Desulfosalsimonas sp.]